MDAGLENNVNNYDDNDIENSLVDDGDDYIKNNLFDDDDQNSYLSFSNDILLDSPNDNMNEKSIGQSNTSMSYCDENNDPLLSVLDIKKSFGLFILQLHEEFCVPKSITNYISSCIVSLLRNLTSIIEQKAVSHACNNILSASSSKTTIQPLKKLIELETVQHTTNEICNTLECLTKTEYQFLNFCNQYFNYTPPEEILLSAPGENLENAYFIPIDQTLKSVLCHSNTVYQIVKHMKQQQQATMNDNDLMFSFRDGSYGSKIDDSNLLIQLYMDDIGLTNPIGARKDRHKLTMIYFLLEDIPDEYRSKLDHIHLLAICDSRILKVTLIFNTICTHLFQIS